LTACSLLVLHGQKLMHLCAEINKAITQFGQKRKTEKLEN